MARSDLTAFAGRKGSGPRNTSRGTSATVGDILGNLRSRRRTEQRSCLVRGKGEWTSVDAGNDEAEQHHMRRVEFPRCLTCRVESQDPGKPRQSKGKKGRAAHAVSVPYIAPSGDRWRPMNQRPLLQSRIRAANGRKWVMTSLPLPSNRAAVRPIPHCRSTAQDQAYAAHAGQDRLHGRTVGPKCVGVDAP